MNRWPRPKLPHEDYQRQNVSRWMANAKPLSDGMSWSEKRLAIPYGDHIYLVENDGIFQCAECGHYAPNVYGSNVIEYFRSMGVKPIEVEVEVTIRAGSDSYTSSTERKE